MVNYKQVSSLFLEKIINTIQVVINLIHFTINMTDIKEGGGGS